MFRTLEFYCGIGGLHWSLEAARPGKADVVAAFDLNPVGNDVYEHNFGKRPSSKTIGSLSAAHLDTYKADVWLLSPPCQPFTRNGLRKDVGDGRAQSFLQVLDKMKQLQHPPSYILVENVVGYETSESRRELVSCLDANGYSWQEFILSPIQFGVPYSRPRYFMLAVRKPLSFKGTPPQSPYSHPPATLFGAAPEVPVRPLFEFLEEPGGAAVGAESTSGRDGRDLWADYAVPEPSIRTSMGAVDVVQPAATRTNCFTKAYAKYCKGAGSILCMSEADQADFEVARTAYIERRERERAASGAAAGPAAAAAPAAEPEDGAAECDAQSEGEGGTDREASGGAAGASPTAAEEVIPLPPLRYFTEREVANLHGFPQSFVFPETVTRLQRYALLGNSLSVVVVAALLDYMLPDEPAA